MRKTKILLIYTGGTIGMEAGVQDEGLVPVSFDKLLDYIPELAKLNCELTNYSFKNPIDSSEANSEFWNDIAEVIVKNYESYDGFVILHGTDTMAYTATALSLMLENLTKPVVITGSQLPMGSLRTDGRENLISSIEIAASLDEDGESRLKEVAIYFEYSLYKGNRCHKFSTEHFDAIISPNYPPLAEAGVTIHWNFSALQRRKKPEGELNLHRLWSNDITIIKFFPGIGIGQLKHQFNCPKTRVFILETFGSGNIPQSETLLELIRKAINEGKSVINVSQCRKGKVDQETYSSGLRLARLGVISAEDMTLEAVVVKSMHLLGKNLLSGDFSREFQISYAGELSVY